MTHPIHAIVFSFPKLPTESERGRKGGTKDFFRSSFILLTGFISLFLPSFLPRLPSKGTHTLSLSPVLHFYHFHFSTNKATQLLKKKIKGNFEPKVTGEKQISDKGLQEFLYYMTLKFFFFFFFKFLIQIF